ncbi:siderophore ABC transporter substrate-binding protein [Rubinisphaera sp. JC750]|uniref:siderophore ABC transporter substrate-binding protein n=1 Tax=Rubinisphaera sp. JC750 TaxID=2898658 RepID=UPI001F44701E|nr:ABC transporter substrate-binding protein [Rubinisphaera sp. JC750]
MSLSATLAAAEEVGKREFAHVQGSVSLPQVPQRTVVLNLAALEILHALEIPVVGVPSLSEEMWPDYLKQYASDNYAKAGSLFEPDLDVINELKPDLIIVGGRSSRQLKTLSKIAPTIDLSTSTTAFIPSVVQNVLTVGAIYDREERANQTARELLNSVRQLHSTAADQGTGLLLFCVGDRVIPQVPATRFGIVYELIGIAPAAGSEDAGPPRQRGVELSDEEKQKQAAAEAERVRKILDREPDWLFVMDRNAAFKERDNASEVLAAHSDVSATAAHKAGQVVHLEGGWYLNGGGMIQLQRTVEQIQAAFENRK